MMRPGTMLAAMLVMLTADVDVRCWALHSAAASVRRRRATVRAMTARSKDYPACACASSR